MAQHSKNYILTLVCILFFMPLLAHGAPSTDFPPDHIDSGLHPREQDKENTSADFLESTRITPQSGKIENIPALSQEMPIIATRKLSHDAIFVGTGVWLGSIVDNTQNDTINYFRIGKSVYDSAKLAEEYTLDLTSTGYFGWSTGYKFIQDIGQHYEPYLKIAMAALYSSNEKIGTFINWERYQIRGEVGCEDLFERGRSLRAELGFSWSGFGGALYVGGNYAF